MKTVAIIGAGPAGLSAAYSLLNHSNEYCVTIFEKETTVGGLSKTFTFDGGRVDIGGHRFFTKDKDVQQLWDRILPPGDQGMLVRDRKSHILWNGKLIQYPVQLNAQTVKSLGFFNGARVILSYIQAKKNQSVHTLEEFYTQRFGKELYSLFFRDYTEKLWGIPPDALSADWGAQRVSGVSMAVLIKSLLRIGGRTNTNERSLITQFQYPAYGSGQLWNALAKNVIEHGGKIETGCTVQRLIMQDSRIEAVEYTKNSQIQIRSFDYVLSSMPLGELILSIDNAPDSIRQTGRRLLYRDMIIVGIELPAYDMASTFETAKEDNWLYMQDKDLTFGRIQILNNWSPNAIFSKESIVLELEFFCTKGDALWEASNDRLIEISLSELSQCGICKRGAKAVSHIVKKIEKAYPIYTDGYDQLDTIINWVVGIHNLRCIGRNGQHRYNNMDHSVEAGLEAAKSILNPNYDQKNIWNINR